MTESGDQDHSPTPGRRKGPGVLRVLQSILAGAFGVQSNRRREEDFSEHSPLPYIIGGILFVLGFVVTVALIVRWVISTQT